MPKSLQDKIVVVLGGSSGIGLETARAARAEGADVIIGGRDGGRLRTAAADVGAVGTATVDATDPDSLHRFIDGLPAEFDHFLTTAGRPYYAPLAEVDLAVARRSMDGHIWSALQIAKQAGPKMRPGGTLLLISGTGARRPGIGMSIIGVGTAAIPALAANLALELAPVRVNVIAAGFVDTPLSADLLGDELEQRRAHLRSTLPIRRVVGPQDIAALAVHIMTNTALTGATYDIDGGQQLVGD